MSCQSLRLPAFSCHYFLFCLSVFCLSHSCLVWGVFARQLGFCLPPPSFPLSEKEEGASKAASSTYITCHVFAKSAKWCKKCHGLLPAQPKQHAQNAKSAKKHKRKMQKWVYVLCLIIGEAAYGHAFHVSSHAKQDSRLWL